MRRLKKPKLLGIVSMVLTLVVVLGIPQCVCLLFLLYQHWTKISKPTGLTAIFRSWPKERYNHAETFVSGPLLVIMGGVDRWIEVTSNCWIYDLTAMLWKKVHVLI